MGVRLYLFRMDHHLHQHTQCPVLLSENRRQARSIRMVRVSSVHFRSAVSLPLSLARFLCYRSRFLTLTSFHFGFSCFFSHRYTGLLILNALFFILWVKICQKGKACISAYAGSNASSSKGTVTIPVPVSDLEGDTRAPAPDSGMELAPR